MKKTWKKILVIVIIVIVVGLAAMISYARFLLPNVGKAEDIKVEATPERIQRGDYLANHVMTCTVCHSLRDWNKYTAPTIPGTLGAGGDAFTEELGFPGNFYATNLTPAGIGSYTDGELFRAITTGVNPEGKALFPLMPYLKYGKLDKEDIYAVLAYLRTLKPVENKIPESKPSFPMSIIINLIPEKAVFTAIPSKDKIVQYGEYLVKASACADCHTPAKKGKPIEGMEFAGGFEFNLPTGGILRAANITPDKTTGLGNWTAENFFDKFIVFTDSTFVPGPVRQNEFNTLMPWVAYSGMTSADLLAMYTYLQSLPAVKNEIIRFTSIK